MRLSGKLELETNPPISLGRVFYRRIKPDFWEDYDSRIPLEAAFYISNTESGLSVFNSADTTPEAVLEHQLEIWKNIQQKPDEKSKIWATKKLSSCSSSISGMREAKWGVIAIEESVFTELGFNTNVPIDRFKHLIIPGTPADFKRVAKLLVAKCYAPNQPLPLSVAEQEILSL